MRIWPAAAAAHIVLNAARGRSNARIAAETRLHGIRVLVAAAACVVVSVSCAW
ncbi:hypothetical protein ACWDF9_31185 [Streptomyces rubiginosohelvolus]